MLSLEQRDGQQTWSCLTWSVPPLTSQSTGCPVSLAVPFSTRSVVKSISYSYSTGNMFPVLYEFLDILMLALTLDFSRGLKFLHPQSAVGALGGDSDTLAALGMLFGFHNVAALNAEKAVTHQRDEIQSSRLRRYVLPLVVDAV